MMKSVVAALSLALIVFASPNPVAAKSYTVPDKDPVAVVTIPDDWDVTEIAQGVEALSEDETVYVAFEVTALKDVSTAIADAIVWLKSKDVIIDRATQDQKPIEINGLSGIQVKWDGKDDDGPTQVSLTVFPVTETRGIILTYWGSADGAKANIKDLTTIITSLKIIK